jgi:effector-binding domain-containing protein
MLRTLSILALFTVVTVHAQPAAEVPKKDAAKSPEFVVSDMRQQTLPAMTLLYGSEQTTFSKMFDVMMKLLPPVSKALEDKSARSNGSCVFIYHNMNMEDKPFTLDVGWMVADDTKVVGELKVKKTEPFKCATVLFTGSLGNIAKAYEKVMAGLGAAGLTPSGESREYYLFWDGAESPNNVVMIAVGVK